MTNTYLTNITPDSFSGLLFGFEGIKHTVVLMNGPTGCKFYHSATSDNQSLRQMEFDPLNYPELWYFGQPRIPCTYLDKRDYVYGSKEKLTEAIKFLQDTLRFDLLVIVNSPGAALIGDDLQRIASTEIGDIPVITVETPGYSNHIWDGYSDACLRILNKFITKRIGPSVSRSPSPIKKVNILGLSIFHKYFQGDILEIKRLLSLCGIEVGCILCCECTIDEIRQIPNADLNLVLDADYGLLSAQYLKEQYNMPYLECTDGLPIGFSAVERWIQDICCTLNLSSEKFITESEKARARAYIYLSRLNSLTGLPKGTAFAIHGTAAQCLSYTKFFVQYFGMTADSISIPAATQYDSSDVKELRRFLRQHKMENAMDKYILHTDGKLVFADGNIIAKLKAHHHSFCGIEIGLPSLGYIDVIPKTHLGLSGSLLLCEQVINGMEF
ncbi:MAG: nitrogenase component 1 [Emergencia sp.]|nr:nitrogenase component 1 [Emergencia sp.]